MNDRTNKKTSLKNPVSIALFSFFQGMVPHYPTVYIQCSHPSQVSCAVDQ